jgi:hypothetical protein
VVLVAVLVVDGDEVAAVVFAVLDEDEVVAVVGLVPDEALVLDPPKGARTLPGMSEQ